MPIYPPYGTYKIPKKNVLVLSCIDLRLTDDTVKFLNHDNLANRYDHFILAGSSLCTCVDQTRADFKPAALSDYEDFEHWRRSLMDHLKIAIDLHPPLNDIYIIEHRNCGAYEHFLINGAEINNDPIKEKEAHAKFAHALAADLKKSYSHLNVHCFLINLRGDVEYLNDPHKSQS